MPATESEFIAIAKHLIIGYERKISRLRAIVADYESESAGQQELDNLVVSRVIQENDTHRSSNGNRVSGAIKLPKRTSSWIRYAIENISDNVTAPKILSTIATVSPAAGSKIKPGWVSTGLYHLTKGGELEVVEKQPGKASVYRKTAKFLTWIDFNRKKRERKTLVNAM